MIDAMSQEKRRDCCNDQRLMNQKRQVKLKTCADVYEHWRLYKRQYKKAPKDGVEFQIDYIDTGLALELEERSKAPIALALHGAPGSYHDFSLLINHLTKQKVRVIAPNFPEYIATVKTKVLFRHSADEKASYLRDFLKAINVTKIDLLISHSSAIFPTLLILLNANNEALARQREENGDLDQKIRRKQEKSLLDNTDERDKQTEISVNQAHGGGDGGLVSVKSFSETGNQLKGNVVGLVEGEDSGNSSSSSSLAGSHESNDKVELDTTNEMFEETIDQLDGNNNSNKCKNDTSVKSGDGPNDTELSHDELNGQRDQLEAPLPSDYETLKGAEGKVAKHRKKRSSRRTPTDVLVKFEEPIEIKAVALFNPAGHRLPKSMKPTWFKCGSVHIYQHKLGRSLFRKFGPAFLTVVGVPVRVDNMDNVMLSATVMRNSKCQRVVNQLQQLSQMRIPTLLVFSENDKLIEREIFYEMTQFMRLDSTKFDVFNNDGDIELSQSNMDDWIRVMVFKAGGHYAYSNYAKTVNKAVSDLLGRVTSAK